MSVRVIKDAAGVAQNKVNSLGVTGLILPADNTQAHHSSTIKPDPTSSFKSDSPHGIQLNSALDLKITPQLITALQPSQLTPALEKASHLRLPSSIKLCIRK